MRCDSAEGSASCSGRLLERRYMMSCFGPPHPPTHIPTCLPTHPLSLWHLMFAWKCELYTAYTVRRLICGNRRTCTPTICTCTLRVRPLCTRALHARQLCTHLRCEKRQHHLKLPSPAKQCQVWNEWLQPSQQPDSSRGHIAQREYICMFRFFCVFHSKKVRVCFVPLDTST